ncbi:hypothetical protein IPA_02135 [Ignicoccus pacificus DSM 13166]|uniref:Uncharacterized protein n=1 Tax=Ignicoccus pacificus DSM 13166 TaxID=940294 RepID=A0A977KC50_9CREN|nr:hypothetical protein IPA_02135 [Ignicoccus pacificus DSM 13166]
MLLESWGLNVPLYAIVDEKNWERAKFYKRQCAIRFDVLTCELPKINARIVPGPPPLIAHSSPCVAERLFEELSRKGCKFLAHVTDVTINDTVGAGVTMKWRGRIISEISIGGSVRDITRRGKVDARAFWEGCKMRIEGPLQGLLSYCAYKSLEVMERLPEGLIEWSCHKGRYGTLGDHAIFWEFVEL